MIPGHLACPPIDILADLTNHPANAAAGTIILSRRGKTRVIRWRRSATFALPAGARIAAGAARDRFGNGNAQAFQVPS